eukprot:6631859-Ditylum_brightwellii.AAC.1
MGEMFHNYWFDPHVQSYAEVDLGILKTNSTTAPQRGCWAGLMMGLTPPPFLSIKTFLWGEEVIREDCLATNNPL